MIRFVQHQDIDPVLWDRVVLNSASPTILATYKYLDLLADGQWDAIIDNHYHAVLPLPWRKKWGVSYIYTPFFLHQLGIFSPDQTSAEYTAGFFNSIPGRFRQVDLLFNTRNDLSLLPLSPTLLVSHVLNLQVTYEELAQHFASNTRRNIKSAEKHFLTIENNDKIILDIVKLFRNNRGRNGSVHYQDKDYQRLVSVAESLQKDGLLDVVGVNDSEHNLVAGALLLHDGNRIVFWFSGRDECAADSKPMFFLINEYLKLHCGQQLTFDFNGSSDPNVARFYQRFGGVPYSIPMVLHSRLGVRWLKVLKQKNLLNKNQ